MKYRTYYIEHPEGHREPVSTYYPLTYEEIVSLLFDLRRAMTMLHPVTFAPIATRIEQRLLQGIQGMTCPEPTQGTVYQRMRQVQKLHLDWIRKNARNAIEHRDIDITQLAQKLNSLLNAG